VGETGSKKEGQGGENPLCDGDLVQESPLPLSLSLSFQDVIDLENKIRVNL
jgi:hypothetical protein